jgi:hypothetical protein
MMEWTATLSMTGVEFISSRNLLPGLMLSRDPETLAICRRDAAAWSTVANSQVAVAISSGAWAKRLIHFAIVWK